MARWMGATLHAVAGSESLLAVLSVVILFALCVTMFVALCAAHGNPQVDNRDSEPEGSPEGRRAGLNVSNNLQIKLSSFRIPSFRKIDCKQVDVVDAFRRDYHPVPEEENHGAAVWQRAILRGERCAPLSFSGLILYDERGNPLRNHTEEYRSAHGPTQTT